MADADAPADAAWTARMRGHVLDADHAWLGVRRAARARAAAVAAAAYRPVQIRVCQRH